MDLLPYFDGPVFYGGISSDKVTHASSYLVIIGLVVWLRHLKKYFILLGACVCILFCNLTYWLIVYII